MSGEFQDKPINTDSRNYSSSAKKGVIVFALGILAVVFFGSFPDLMPSWEKAGKVTSFHSEHGPNRHALLRRLDHGDCQCLSEEARRRFRLPLRFNRHGRSLRRVLVNGYFLQFLQTDVCCRVRNMIQGAPILLRLPCLFCQQCSSLRAQP